VFLPPFSPDLNPIERLWLLVKAEWFADFFAKNREQLLEWIGQALLWLMNRTGDNQRTCSLERFVKAHSPLVEERIFGKRYGIRRAL